MKRSHLKPGEAAPTTGLYRIHHYAHRLPHDCFVKAGKILPPCNICGDRVRFESLAGEQPAPLEFDRDLKAS